MRTTIQTVDPDVTLLTRGSEQVLIVKTYHYTLLQNDAPGYRVDLTSGLTLSNFRTKADALKFAKAYLIRASVAVTTQPKKGE